MFVVGPVILDYCFKTVEGALRIVTDKPLQTEFIIKTEMVLEGVGSNRVSGQIWSRGANSLT